MLYILHIIINNIIFLMCNVYFTHEYILNNANNNSNNKK